MRWPLREEELPRGYRLTRSHGGVLAFDSLVGARLESGGFGPELVTPDELPKPVNDLRIQCRLNGESMQDSNTGQHIFQLFRLRDGTC